MRCSVCTKESDVLAEGKCVSCFEQASMPQMQAAPQPGVPGMPIDEPRPDTQGQQSISRTGIQHEPETITLTPSSRKVRTTMNVGSIAGAHVLPQKKKSVGKKIAKYAVFAVLSLGVASVITYVKLFVLDTGAGTDGELNQASLSTATQILDENAKESEKETDAEDEEQVDDTEKPEEEEDAEPAADDSEGKYIDTDKDGMPDYIEDRMGTDDRKADSDGDTISDLVELREGTDPMNEDTDGDGFKDSIDADPNDPLVTAALGDADKGPENVSDREEVPPTDESSETTETPSAE